MALVRVTGIRSKNQSYVEVRKSYNYNKIVTDNNVHRYEKLKEKFNRMHSRPTCYKLNISERNERYYK